MSMSTTRWCAWGGIVATVIWVIGFFAVSGFVPAPSPFNTAAHTAEIFRGSPDQIRLGLVITCFGACLVVPWAVAISVCMKRMEGRYHPLADCNLALGLLLLPEFCFPIFAWEAATYRPDRTDQMIQLLNDLGWIPFMGMVFSVIPQGVAIALVIMRDKRAEPIFPRWVAYLNLWFVLTMLPGAILSFFKAGPFAWNGVLTFWVAMVGYISWTLVMSIWTVKATHRLEQEDRELSIMTDSPDLELIRRSDLLTADMAAMRNEMRMVEHAPRISP
jgi:hypothetical protein